MMNKRMNQHAVTGCFVALLALAPLAASRAQTAEQPIAVLQGKKPGTRLEILSLKRSDDDMLTLRLAYVNEAQGKVLNGDLPGLTVGGDSGHGNMIFLMDFSHKKRYAVVADSSGKCLCTTNFFAPSNWTFDPGRKVVWAKYPAPPDAMTRISVLIGEEEPIDVPITQ
ncbi:MAG: hypothetical protein LBP99_00510 [Azoarcus sp.]|jgi:hypothetical protein|nr:hypothetical protein [Azoarcus sp.]